MAGDPYCRTALPSPAPGGHECIAAYRATGRLETGAAILAAAQVVDTAPIKSRLAAFTAAHRSYVAAQDKVDAAEADLRTAQTKIDRRELAADEAVEALALALAAFGPLTPSLVKHLTGNEKATAIHQLVAAVQRAKAVSQETREIANAAEEAGRGLETALVPVDQLEASLREVRRQRDTIGRKWETTLAALRRETRSAADDGAPGLYPALFGEARRRKRAQPVPAPTPAPPDTPAAAT
jgi:hypothetical protein